MDEIIRPTEERIRRATKLARQLLDESGYQMALAIAMIDVATDHEMDAIEKIIKTARKRRGVTK